MIGKSLKYVVVMLIAVVAMQANSQTQRVGSVNPLNRNHASYGAVYEYDLVDVQPQFPGGERGLMNYINKTREYPYHAYQRRIQGRVLCSFIVAPDGSVTNVTILRGTGDESLNREAVRVISSMPKWKAGKMGKENVAVHCIIPIAFRL